jgi:hypothetical protein
VLERLKRLFRPKDAADVEYARDEGEGPVVMPSGPLTSGMPPAAPVNDPVADERGQQPE